MIQIGPAKEVVAPDAHGRDSRCIHTPFEIEEEDIGHIKPNYLGHGRPGVKLSRQHVGKQIVVYSDGTGWNCWSFN